MKRTMPVHWVYRGETACGIAFRSQTHGRRTTTDATKVTCAKCIGVQFALVGQSDVRAMPFELVNTVRYEAGDLPTSGWAGDRVRKAYRSLAAARSRVDGSTSRAKGDRGAFGRVGAQENEK